MCHNESKLPKWTQKRMTDLRLEVEKLRGLRKLHSVLANKRDWFPISPSQFDGELKERLTLWVIENDQPRRFCTLLANDSLFIGRKPKTERDSKHGSSIGCDL